MSLDFAQFIPSIPYILQGITVTLQIVILAGILGFVLGTILSLLKISKFKFLGWLADAYTSIFRGTPMIL
jgi:polar amino acid transport system permease protein